MSHTIKVKGSVINNPSDNNIGGAHFVHCVATGATQTGVVKKYSFLKKFWGLFFKDGLINVSEDEPSKESLKSLHKTIKKINEDIEKLSLNTCVSSFMICINELTVLKCSNREILEPLLVLLSF